jgi:hypothetical protein
MEKQVMVYGGMKKVKYVVKPKRKAELDPNELPYAKLMKKASKQKCFKCWNVRPMVGAVCLDCLHSLRRQHEEHEATWDLSPEDIEKLNAPGVLEQFVWLMMQPRGEEAIEAWLGIDLDAVRAFWRNFKASVCNGDERAIEIKETYEKKLRRGETSPYSHLIPEAGSPRRPAEDPCSIQRTLRRRKKAAALAESTPKERSIA